MARTIRREHRLTPRIRTAALRLIADVAPHSRMRILAVAVMSNHLHIVVQQGPRPLSALMQPLLRRLALLLQDSHGLEGPVFWRPYASQPCMDPSHARNAIAYTHLNPFRAGLCDEPSDYPWTTHRLYLGDPALTLPAGLDRLASVVDPDLALPLYATGPYRSQAELHRDYRAFIDWRIQADRADDEATERDPLGEQSPPAPGPWRDSRWATHNGALFRSPVSRDLGQYDGAPAILVPDLASVARRTLAAEAPGVKLDSIRGRRGGARAVELRHLIIRRLHAVGFRNVEIARFLGLSESAISYVLCRHGPLASSRH